MAKKKFKFDGLIQAAEQQKAAVEQKQKTSEGFIKKNIQIREEFKNLIPPLSLEEFSQLEENILAEGCRDALVVWKDGEDYVLIDGHNRYQICTKHGLDFKVQILEFEDKEVVSDWMVNNQLGKRNVTEETKSYLRGIQYNREKKKIGGTGSNQYNKQEGQNVPTAERLAEEHKVSGRTIKRDEKYALAIDKIAGNNKNLKWDILNKKIDLPKGVTLKMHDEEEEVLIELGTYLAEGLNFDEALHKAKSQNQAPTVLPKKKSDPDPQKLRYKELKAHIVSSLNQAIKKQDKAFLEEARQYLKELERALEA